MSSSSTSSTPSKSKVDDYEPTEYEDGPAPITRIQSIKLDSPTYALLRDVKVDHFVRKDHKMVIFKKTDTLDTAVRALSDSKLLSAPVFDEHDQCLGFCDIRDMMQFIISVVTADSGTSTVTDDAWKAYSKQISSTKLADVVNYSGQNPYIPVFETAELSQAAQFLRKPHVHRAAILNSSNEVSGILSQSDIIKYVAKHLEDTPDLKILGAQTLKSLKGQRDDSKDSADMSLSHIASTTTVVQALTTMKSKGLSVVAVTDDHGKLVGEFSSSDLRGLSQDNFSRLLATVADFLKSHSKEGTHPNTVKIDATLKDLLSLISERHCHHVWVVDGDGKPTSLISLTDVMMFITQ